VRRWDQLGIEIRRLGEKNTTLASGLGMGSSRGYLLSPLNEVAVSLSSTHRKRISSNSRTAAMKITII